MHRPRHRDDYVWSQDAGSNPYISQTTTTLDQGNPAVKRVSITTATLDSHGYGNPVSGSVYDYAPSSPPLLRTNAATYLHDSSGWPNGFTGAQYDAAYIRNRVLIQSVTPAGGSPVTITSNTYDGYGYPYYGVTTDAPSMQQHDVNMGTSVLMRGNMTNVYTPSGTTWNSYDIEGNVVYTYDSLGHTTSINVDSYGNVPSTVTPNSNGYLADSFSFNQFLGLTSASQPSNGTTESTGRSRAWWKEPESR